MYYVAIYSGPLFLPDAIRTLENREKAEKAAEILWSRFGKTVVVTDFNLKEKTLSEIEIGPVILAFES